MIKMEKVTIMEQINAISFEGLTEDQFDFLVERARKSVRKASAKKGMTKDQKEKAEVKAHIYAVLVKDGAMTATAIGNALGISCQKTSALLKQMVEDGEVAKVKDGKATVFSALPADEVDEGEDEGETE